MPDLAPYATHHTESRGRFYDEPESKNRTVFQRDRDRIIHADAFRRLQYKTQVFVNHEGDQYRTRLTHSMEVAQITRDVCRALRLDEDLGEAIALAHDLGHPPFGHAGEDALDEALKEYGGYRHNEQTLRVVRHLEQRYAEFDGLNLTWECLEGMAKHNGPEAELTHEDGTVFAGLEVNTWSGPEAQVAALADDIAYNHHDIDDALRAGILTLEELAEVKPFGRIYKPLRDAYHAVAPNRLVRETLRRMITAQVQDVLAQTQRNLDEIKPQSVADIRLAGRVTVDFSPEVWAETKELKAFLRQRVYSHYRVNRMALKAHQVVKALCATFMEHRGCLPNEVQRLLPADKNDLAGKAQVVRDYVSMLTDRSALQEYDRLFDLHQRT